MDEKYPLNPNIIGLIHALLITALAFGGKDSTRLNVLLFLLIALLCIQFVFFSASENRSADYVLSLTVTTLFFAASDYILLRNHQPELRKIGQKRQTEQMSIPERLWWATTLDVATRGVGWAHEPTGHIAPRPMKSRARFILSQLARIAYYFLIFDISSIMVRANPCFGTGGPSFGAFGWLWRATVWIYPLASATTLTMVYGAASVVGVAVGLSEPRGWPHLFGSPWDAYTVRNAWGRVWHQMLRKLLTGHTNFVADVLRLPQGKFKTYFKLYGSFFISGLLHYAADYMLFQNWSGTSIRFFVLQAVAITFEDIAIALASRLGFNRNMLGFRVIGYVWVFAWFAFSLPIWLDPIVHAGTMDEGVNVSLILGVWRGDWTPKRTVT